MKAQNDKQGKQPYRKPVLKAVRVKPREVLGSNCHNSVNNTAYGAVFTCDLSGCEI